jgi:hypothetical protein
MWKHAAVLALGLASACADTSSSSKPDWVVPSDPGKGDTWDEVTLSADGYTLTLDRELVRDNDTFILSGEVDQPLASGAAFTGSHAHEGATPIGQWSSTTPGGFELSMSVAEMGRLMSGEGLILELTPQGAPAGTHLLVELESEVRVSGFDGAVNPQLLVVPYWVDGRVAYRFSVAANDGKWYGGALALAGDWIPSVEETGGHAHFDIPEPTALTAFGADEKFDLIEIGGEGYFTPLVARVRMASVKLSASDWLVPQGCYVGGCLDHLPAGTNDTSSCGEALEIIACQGEHGITVDEALIGDALGANPVDTQMLSDLVGADRVSQMTAGVEGARTARLAGRKGAWYLDATAARASLAGDLDRVWGEALARPLDWVTPRPLRMSATVSAGEVAADALLRYLENEDLIHSEYSAPLEVITRDQPADHVEVFKALRAGVNVDDGDFTLEVDGDASLMGFTTGWLGAYIEISVHPDADADVYFEID